LYVFGSVINRFAHAGINLPTNSEFNSSPDALYAASEPINLAWEKSIPSQVTGTLGLNTSALVCAWATFTMAQVSKEIKQLNFVIFFMVTVYFILPAGIAGR
jgi:hypothetical protein